MNTSKKYFKFSDAWVFTSLYMYDSKFKKINLTNIIANGDALNHSIFEIEELKSAFTKLVEFDLIEIENDLIRLTEKGCQIKEKAENDKGGLFQKNENILKRINSVSTLKINHKLLEESKFDFLNEKNFETSCENYTKL